MKKFRGTKGRGRKGGDQGQRVRRETKNRKMRVKDKGVAVEEERWRTGERAKIDKVGKREEIEVERRNIEGR